MKRPVNKWVMVVIILFILIVVSAVVDISITRSVRDIWYYAISMYLLVSINNFVIGIKTLREAKKKGQPSRWYMNAQMNSGWMFLILGLFYLLTYGIDSKIPNAIGIPLLLVFAVVLGVPFFIFLFLIIKYRPRLQRKTSDSTILS